MQKPFSHQMDTYTQNQITYLHNIKYSLHINPGLPAPAEINPGNFPLIKKGGTHATYPCFQSFILFSSLNSHVIIGGGEACFLTEIETLIPT